MSLTPFISVAIFASGSGTNAENIIQYFKSHPNIVISSVITNNPDAGVIQRVSDYNIPVRIISKKSLGSAIDFKSLTVDIKIDFIVLAGFLLKIPDWMVSGFTDRIINIHPALLPKYGGKGMYGMYVHNAVKNAGDDKTGITIHLVNENYDEGEILLQAFCKITDNMTAEKIALQVHKLEYAYYPVSIEYYITQKTAQ